MNKRQAKKANKTKPSRVSGYQLQRLYERASRGDQASLRELRRLNTLAVNRTTRRLKTIHKYIPSTPAEDRLFKDIKRFGRERLSKSNKLTAEELRAQLEAIDKFEEAKTSTYKGYQQYEREELQRLEEMGIILDSRTFRIDWHEFLNSEAFQMMKDFDSERALIEGAEALKNGHTVEELNDAWQQYQTQNGYFSEVWEKFTGNPFV